MSNGWAWPVGLIAASLAFAATLHSAESIAPGGPGAGVIDAPAIAVASPSHVVLDTATVAGKRVIAGGEHGVIILSEDDGVTWHQATAPVSATITSLAFLDARTGYAVGHFGVVLRTDDAGEHWRALFDGRSIPPLMEAAAGDDARAHRAAAIVAKDGPDKPFLIVRVTSDRLQAFGAAGLAVESPDGGATWHDISRTIENPDTLNLYGLAVRVDGSLVLVGEQGLMVGPLAGAHLRKLPSPSTGSFFGLNRLRDGRLLAYGLVGHAYLSDSAGDQWKTVHTERPVTLTAAIERADGAVLVGDAQGQIWRLDGGSDPVPTLTQSGLRAPWPVTAFIETPAHTLLVFGPGGVVRLPQTPP